MDKDLIISRQQNVIDALVSLIREANIEEEIMQKLPKILEEFKNEENK